MLNPTNLDFKAMPDPIDLGIVAMPNYIFYKKYLKYS
jgi:hypothetical protein